MLTLANATLLFRTRVGCSHWGPGCWIPGFKGTDSSPAIGGGNLVTIGSYDGALYGVDATNGSIRWKAHGAGGEGSPAFLDSSVYVWGGLQGKKLDCIDAASGAITWEWTPDDEGKITTSGAVDVTLGLVFAGTSSTRALFAVNASSGKTVWRVDAGGEMWGTLGPQLVGDDLVCVGVGGAANPYADCNASLLCVKRTTGATVWRAHTGKQVQSRPSVGRATLFVGDYDHCVYAMAIGSGERR